MLNDKDTEAMFRMVNENADYHKIAEYIIMRFNIDLDMQQAKKMAEHLVKGEGFSKEEVFQGLADQSIRDAISRENEIKCDPPLSSKELDTLISSALKYNKSYSQ